MHQQQSQQSQQSSSSQAGASSQSSSSSAAGVSSNSAWMGNAASYFKGTSFLKTIKDASSKVIDTVQSSINRTDLDMNYITSRLIVMSTPTEGIESAAFGNNADLIKEAIESKHGRNYRIYNMSTKTFRKDRFSQVIDLGAQLVNNRAPSITFMCKLCANIVKFLNDSDAKQSVAIISCSDGKALSAIAVSTLMMYFGLIKNVDSCLNLFHVKRGSVVLTASQYRYLKDTEQMFASERNELSRPIFLSPNDCLLSSLVLTGVPMFNRLRTGCTPYIEIYNKEKKIYTNLQDYDSLKKFSTRDGQITIPVNCHKFYGDMTIIVFHAKSLLGTEKVTSTRICQIQFHTAFVSDQMLNSNRVVFTKNDLEGLDSPDKYPDKFSVVLNCELKNSRSPLVDEEIWNNRDELASTLNKASRLRNLIFSNPDELNQLVKVFGRFLS
jgi:cyclin G-associated kinase